jgi:hypothetical protein
MTRADGSGEDWPDSGPVSQQSLPTSPSEAGDVQLSLCAASSTKLSGAPRQAPEPEARAADPDLGAEVADADVRSGPNAGDGTRAVVVVSVRLDAITRADSPSTGWRRRDRESRMRAQLVERPHLISCQAEASRDLTAICQLARPRGAAPQRRRRLAHAIGENGAERVDYRVFGPVRPDWVSLGGADPAAITGALDWCTQSLTAQVGTPFRSLAATAGASDSVAGLVGGIGADLVLIPVIHREERTTSLIDVLVIGIAFVVGHPHMAVTAIQHLLRTEFHVAIERGFSRTLGDLFSTVGPPSPNRPRSTSTPRPTIAPTRTIPRSMAARRLPADRLALGFGRSESPATRSGSIPRPPRDTFQYNTTRADRRAAVSSGSGFGGEIPLGRADSGPGTGASSRQ